MKKTAVKLAAMVAATLLVLTGCADSNPKVAATVGTAQIMVAEVDTVAKVVAANSPDAPQWGQWRGSVLQVMVVSRLAADLKDQAGVTISDADRNTVYNQSALYKALAEDPSTKAFMVQLADATVMLSDATASAAFAKYAPSVLVEVNPTFGQWDQANVKLSGTSGSLSSVLS